MFHLFLSFLSHLYCAATFEPERRHLLPLDHLQSALSMHGTTMETDELECILANLIFHKYIKGYIAHQKCLVLTKQGNPFPQTV